jgi:hypothetical protein
MLDAIAPRCQAGGCDRELTDAEPTLVYRTAEGERRAYECACGAVTVTVARSDRS